MHIKSTKAKPPHMALPIKSIKFVTNNYTFYIYEQKAYEETLAYIPQCASLGTALDLIQPCVCLFFLVFVSLKYFGLFSTAFWISCSSFGNFHGVSYISCIFFIALFMPEI